MNTISPLADDLTDDLADDFTPDTVPGESVIGAEITAEGKAGEVGNTVLASAELVPAETLPEVLNEANVEANADATGASVADLPNIFATKNLPRSVAFARCPTIAEALLRYDIVDPILLARLTEARISPALQLRCSDFPDPLLLLAVVDFDMPDVVGVLPIWQQMAHASPRAELRVIGYDEMPLLERVLNGDSALDLDAVDLPTLLLLDEEFQVQGQWGPRPQAAERYIEDWLADHADFERLAEDDSAEGIAGFAALNLDLVRNMRVWYNSGLDKDCSTELDRLLASMQGEGSESGTPAVRAGNDADAADDSDAEIE